MLPTPVARQAAPAAMEEPSPASRVGLHRLCVAGIAGDLGLVVADKVLYRQHSDILTAPCLRYLDSPLGHHASSHCFVDDVIEVEDDVASVWNAGSVVVPESCTVTCCDAKRSETVVVAEVVDPTFESAEDNRTETADLRVRKVEGSEIDDASDRVVLMAACPG